MSRRRSIRIDSDPLYLGGLRVANDPAVQIDLIESSEVYVDATGSLLSYTQSLSNFFILNYLDVFNIVGPLGNIRITISSTETRSYSLILWTSALMQSLLTINNGTSTASRDLVFNVTSSSGFVFYFSGNLTSAVTPPVFSPVNFRIRIEKI